MVRGKVVRRRVKGKRCRQVVRDAVVRSQVSKRPCKGSKVACRGVVGGQWGSVRQGHGAVGESKGAGHVGRCRRAGQVVACGVMSGQRQQGGVQRRACVGSSARAGGVRQCVVGQRAGAGYAQCAWWGVW